MIEAARARASHAVNTELIDLYWRVGQYISQKISAEGWGRRTVVALADFIRRRGSGIRGFSAQNLWRMRQFYQAYSGRPILSALLRELSWTNNLLILGKSKRPEEREFYLRLPHHGDNPIGKAFNRATKYVVTRSLDQLDWKKSQRIGGEVVDELRRLKASDGPTLQVWGSSELLQTLIVADLVDEHRLWPSPNPCRFHLVSGVRSG